MKGGVHNLPAYPICYLQPLPNKAYWKRVIGRGDSFVPVPAWEIGVQTIHSPQF